MKIPLIGSAIGGITSLISFLVAFKPESFFNDDYSFFAYSIDVLAIPIAIFFAFVGLVFLVCLIPGSSAAIDKFLNCRKGNISTLKEDVKNYSSFSQAILAVVILIAVGHTYYLARNVYSFGRDVLFPRYRSEISARIYTDVALGNLYSARQQLLEYSERFKGQQRGVEAKKKAEEISKKLAIKDALINRAKSLERTFGVNKTSVHLKAEALRINYWDTELRKNLLSDRERVFAGYLPALLVDISQCGVAKVVIDKVRIGRHFMLLGYERAVDAELRGNKSDETRTRLCEMVSEIGLDGVETLVRAIWQVDELDLLLKKSDETALRNERAQKFAAMRYSNTKIRLLSRDEINALTDEESADIQIEWDEIIPAPPPPMKIKSSD